MYTLGINAAFHDSSACILKDGQLLAAAEEERFNPWDPLFLSYIVNAPAQLKYGWPHHLQQHFYRAKIDPAKWHFVDHHLSHAASAFHVSPHAETAVITLDGRGEKATTSYYIGKGNDRTCIGQVNMPHSLGLLYERMTTYRGFLHSSDEYKVMALASYGKPEFVDDFRKIPSAKTWPITFPLSGMWMGLRVSRPLTKTSIPFIIHF